MPNEENIWDFRRADTATEGGRSAQDILLQLDPNYSKAVGILNKYLPSDTSSSYNPDDLNQNRALGPESEGSTLSQGNTTTGSEPKKGNKIESENRAGSTLSDLHQTEYIDESKRIRSKATTPSSKSPPSKLTGPQSPPFSPKPSPREPSHKELTPSPGGTPVKTQEKIDIKRSKSPANRSATSSEPKRRSPSPSPRPQKKGSSRSASDGTKTSGSANYRLSPSDEEADEEEEMEEEMEEEIEEEGEEEGGTQMFTEPDPTAARDLQNASPKTKALCARHQVHYCFFVYFPSYSVDEDLMPFRRKVFIDKVSRITNPKHVKEVKETKCARDAYADRRIKSIERRSGTQIRLSELDPNAAFIKGLPRRRLTIAGPSFANISCALNLFEDLLPKVVKSATFPYRLPEGASTRFSSGCRASSTYHWEYGRPDGSVSLRRQLDDKGGWRSFYVPNKGPAFEKA